MDVEEYTRVVNALDRERDQFEAFMHGVEMAIGQDLNNFDTIHDFRTWVHMSFREFVDEKQ